MSTVGGISSGKASKGFDFFENMKQDSDDILRNHNNNVVGKTKDEVLNNTGRLFRLLYGLEKLLSEKHAFDVFAPNSVNFGILITYRQKWEPLNYQVGDLVSTIPLAPKEVRKYTKKVITKKSRAMKEIDDALRIRKQDSSDTSRVDSEIVQNAQNKTVFNVTATESFGGGEKIPYHISSTQTLNTDQSKQSQQTKKDFRESVLRSSEEYKHQHRIEIDTSESEETEVTNLHEIQNPNDELPVTYLFYELQRTYRISEKIHKVTPVIFVANDVPSPREITDAWLIEHDWILNRVILDDSFRPALQYISKSMVGAEVNIRILQANVHQQKIIVNNQNQLIQTQNQLLFNAQQDVKTATQASAKEQKKEGFIETVKSVFDPLGLIKDDTGGVNAAQTIVDYSKDTLGRAEKEKARLESQLELAITALQAATDKLSAAVKEHYDHISEIDRLRIHIKDNILYYMQAIWNYEPPDQRFFRLYNLDVPVINPVTAGVTAKVSLKTKHSVNFSQLGLDSTALSIELPIPNFKFQTKKLCDIADLDNLLGYKGNYMIFPLKENNYITFHMMQDYLEIGDEITVKDPDEFGNYTLEEIQELMKCIHKKDPKEFEKHKEQFKKLIIDRLASPRPETDLVIVPTTSLYIEALVGSHPLLEGFKLAHRALDVKKVQAEVRHLELENIRLAARALKGKYADPDIEKKIIIEGDTNSKIVAPDDT